MEYTPLKEYMSLQHFIHEWKDLCGCVCICIYRSAYITRQMLTNNSHIRHSRAGRALLRWRKECGRLWVLLGSTVHMVQAGPHAQSGMCIDSYLFLPEISSFVITCTYRFTTDDNHLQNSTILSSVICVIQVISSHYINPTLIFFSELDRGIIWKFCIIRLQ